MKRTAAVVSIYGVVCCAAMLTGAYSFEENYRGFMRVGATSAVLPVALMLMCLGRTRYTTLELVRHDPRGELRANGIWLAFVSVMCAVLAAAIFAVMEFVVGGQSASPGHWSLVAMLFVQCLMMAVSVCLLQLLLANCGLPWEYVTPVLAALFIIAQWMLTVLPGDAVRFAYYFWYPIGLIWPVVVVNQCIPFLGYCVLMCLINVGVFAKRDRLGR